MTSPTQQSLKYLKDNGYMAQIVERFNPYAKVRVDLFGFIDIVAVGKSEILGIQTTSTHNMNARSKKIFALKEVAKNWLESGAKIYIHGWSKKGKVGKRKTYQVRIVEITLSDIILSEARKKV